MGAEIPSNAASLQEFQSEVGLLKSIANIPLTWWGDLIREEDKNQKGSHLRIALASVAEGLISDPQGSLVDLIAVIEGRERLNKYLADNVSEMRNLVEFFQKELGEVLGQEAVAAAITTLRKIEDCSEVVAKKKEYEDTRNI